MYCTWGGNETWELECVEQKLCLQGMKGECVHGPHVVDIVYRLPMTLERVLLVLDFLRGVDIFHRDSSFDGSRGITCKVSSGRSMEALAIRS